MPIDWFTVIAQTVNFLILLWLLKRFLYHPIINGLNKRETKIAQILSAANDKNQQAEALQAEYQLKLSQIEKQRSEIIRQSNQEAKDERQKLLALAQQEAADILANRLQGIEQDMQSLQQEVVIKSMQEVYATCRKVLRDLADSDVQNLMFDKLLLQLTIMDSKQHAEIDKAVNSNLHISIHSTFALSAAQKNTLQQWFIKTYSKDNAEAIKFIYTLNPELICGIEVIFDGWKIPWSAHNYLNLLKESINHQIPKTSSLDLTDDLADDETKFDASKSPNTDEIK
ncbi:F0F1 ATP synthase subunit delta [Aliiglaciecola lipolytica]|uniref:F0F1 ATP synthase subunit delta n=1 Tax=Aliiglaciecola lipolytica TaxID=477689 RepID=UPI001C09CC86|nr:F0F1 ATP synthase subunit delta [Aliiglaciecola lipolytica]MBU2878250.1 F0F1 ATP synthase subunit B [Aliiglaciecola lipolytica]